MKNKPMVEEVYQQRISFFAENLTKTKRQLRMIAGLRLLVALFSFALLYTTWNAMPVGLWLLQAVACIAMFLFLVSKDSTAKEKMSHLQRLIDCNEEEIKILNHQFLHRETGIEYLPPHHAYAEDLDLFGKASLFQYINRCTSEEGKKLFAAQLLHPSNSDQIKAEQEAIAELKNKTDFRQQIQAIGAAQNLTSATQNKLNNWLQLPLQFTANYWRWLALIFPVFTIVFILLFFFNIVSSGLFWMMVFVCYLVAFFISSKISKTYETLSKISREMQTLQKLLATIENETFESKKLVHFKNQLANTKGVSTVTEIKKLYKILNRFDARLNTFLFFFLNTFLLWDLQQLLALNKWKQHNRQSVANWLVVIAQMEASNSLAILFFNHPNWCLPVISDHFFEMNASGVAHPLLPEEQRVSNDFTLEGKGNIAIVTGSNMGGKSTFLRSVGVNAVLALMGAPVCAHSFTFSFAQLMTSMRVADNLAENASTFYAELKKLKNIIEAVNKKQPVLILLDEILRGTNSLDRHTGSVALLKQLIRNNAVAIIATHDVELANLKQNYPQAIENYHFDVQANGDELLFDYKLKKGICQSLNASILMKNIGIEME